MSRIPDILPRSVGGDAFIRNLWRPTVLFYGNGPLPISSINWTKVHADTQVVLFLSATGFLSSLSSFIIDVEVLMDAVGVIMNTKVATNEAGSHKSTIPRLVRFPDPALGTPTIAVGAHSFTIRVNPSTPTVTDNNDWFQFMAWEVPAS